jgi:plasmid stabilization system protein ParE
VARKIVWTAEAVANLQAIFDFIARDSEPAAALTISRILDRAEQAAQFPLSGRMVPEFGIPALRELFWREYRIFYRVLDEAVVVRGVVHGRRILGQGPGESEK